MNAPTEFGSNLGFLWETDPRMIGIRLARYKFVAKMLAGARRVLEVGAGDGALSRIVEYVVGTLNRCDLEPQGSGIEQLDLTREAPAGKYDAIYALDVLEHVAAAEQDAFLGNLRSALSPFGTCIIGMPSLESQQYASDISRRGHVNCKTEAALRELMLKHFRNVYLFGMNDETLHTGFGPMCHYRLALATGARS